MTTTLFSICIHYKLFDINLWQIRSFKKKTQLFYDYIINLMIAYLMLINIFVTYYDYKLKFQKVLI